MSGRTSMRDVVVGLLVIAALVGLLGLMRVASDGPGSSRRRRRSTWSSATARASGSAARCGSPGSTPGNVVDLDLIEVEGTLRARVRISLPGQPGQEAAAGREGDHQAGPDGA